MCDNHLGGHVGTTQLPRRFVARDHVIVNDNVPSEFLEGIFDVRPGVRKPLAGPLLVALVDVGLKDLEFMV